MTGSRTPAEFQGGDHGAIDVPLAALAGLSIGFLLFAAPAGALSILPAAEMFALAPRIALAATGAAFVFALAFLLLRRLGRAGRRRSADRAGDRAEAPRLRRRDSHPDAPARVPLMAGHELGEPALWAQSDAISSATAAVTGPVPTLGIDHFHEFNGLWPGEPVEPEPPPRSGHGEKTQGRRAGSISDLVDRLEQSLAQRRGSLPPAAQPTAPARDEFMLQPEERLQCALDRLQRFAARG